MVLGWILLATGVVLAVIGYAVGRAARSVAGDGVTQRSVSLVLLIDAAAVTLAGLTLILVDN